MHIGKCCDWKARLRKECENGKAANVLDMKCKAGIKTGYQAEIRSTYLERDHILFCTGYSVITNMPIIETLSTIMVFDGLDARHAHLINEAPLTVLRTHISLSRPTLGFTASPHKIL